MRGIATATRYSAAECQRIARVVERKQFGLFAQLGIEEAREDRLIFIARTPSQIGPALSRASVMALMSRNRLAQRRSA
ncbi:MAG: hypothetical protein Q8M37_03750 [Nevskia sp.]|nr:hypothetical protein [Nevskia sp.]